MTVSKKDAQYLSVIFLLITAVFSRALTHYFLRDETAMLRNIHDFPAVLGLFQGFRLIPALMFEAVYAVCGINPAGYYFVNFLLHVINAFLLYFLASLLLSKDGETRHAEAGFLSSLYFSVTFSHHETVFYIPGISDLLAAFFCLLCVLNFVFYSRSAKRVHYGLSCLFFACFLLSKPTAVLFPFCMLVLMRLLKMPAKLSFPYFIFLFIYLVLPWTEKGSLFSSYMSRGEPLSFLSVSAYYFGDLFFSLAGYTSSALWFSFPFGYFGEFCSVRILKVLAGLLCVSFLFCVLSLPGSRKNTSNIFSLNPYFLFVFFLSCAVFIFLPQSFLPELYPVRRMLIQYRYLYLPACFFSCMIAMAFTAFYARAKNSSPDFSSAVLCLFFFMTAINAYETYGFGKSIGAFSDFARKSVKQVTKMVHPGGKSAWVVVLNPPPLRKIYFQTCITDMVAVASREKIRMDWIEVRTQRDMLDYLESRGIPLSDFRFFSVNGAGFFDVTSAVRSQLSGVKK